MSQSAARPLHDARIRFLTLAKLFPYPAQPLCAAVATEAYQRSGRKSQRRAVVAEWTVWLDAEIAKARKVCHHMLGVVT